MACLLLFNKNGDCRAVAEGPLGGRSAATNKPNYTIINIIIISRSGSLFYKYYLFFCYLPTTALDLFFSRGGSLFYYFVLVGSFNFVLLGSFNFVLLGSYTCKYKYNNNRRCLQLPAVRRYCLTRPGASPEGGLGVSWQLARFKVVFFFWLYVHGTDITLPPGGVFTRDWDGSLD